MSAPVFPTFAPASPLATPLTGLMWITLGLGLAVFFLMSGILFYLLRRYRHRGARGEPPQVFGNAREEILWMGLATLILVFLFALSIRVSGQSSPATEGHTPEITVTGRQWFWQASYPGGAVSAGEIHIPAGRPVLLALESGDVIHDFWAYRLGRKMDAVPGQHNRLWVQADRPGRYDGACSEYCGAQHAWMRFVVVAQSPADYARWLAHTARPAQPAPGDAGRQLFLQSGCPACHAVKGVTQPGQAGQAGPDLTHFGSRGLLAGGVLSNTPEHLKRWLRDPNAVKPGTHMPKYPFNETQLAALTRSLEALK